MSDYGVLENLEDIESDHELDEELALLVESDEEARRARIRRRPVRTGTGSGYYRPRPNNRFVTQAQLQAALAKISNDVKANAAGVKAVGVRVDAVAAEQRRQNDAAKKEATKRREELSKLKNGLQMSSLLPLITSKSIEVAETTDIGGTRVEKGTRLQVAPDTLSTLLPLMLFGDGLGGSGGDNSQSLLMVLALSGGLGKK